MQEQATLLFQNEAVAMIGRDIPKERNSSDRVNLTLRVVLVRGKHTETPERLSKLAYEALYEDKATGRNCAIFVVKPNQSANRSKLVAAS